MSKDALKRGRIADNEKLLEQLGSLAVSLSVKREQPQLTEQTQAYVDNMRQAYAQNCRLCATALFDEGMAATMIRVRPRHAQDRRRRFLMRFLVCLFSDRLQDAPPWRAPALPRAVLPGFEVFLAKVMGSVAYGDLNSDADQLLALHPDESDQSLRTSLFSRADSRLMTHKLLIRCLLAFGDMQRTHDEFLTNLRHPTDVRFQASETHFHTLFDAMFGRVFDLLQDHSQTAEIERYFGLGIVERLLGVMEAYTGLVTRR